MADKIVQTTIGHCFEKHNLIERQGNSQKATPHRSALEPQAYKITQTLKGEQCGVAFSNHGMRNGMKRSEMK